MISNNNNNNNNSSFLTLVNAATSVLEEDKRDTTSLSTFPVQSVTSQASTASLVSPLSSRSPSPTMDDDTVSVRQPSETTTKQHSTTTTTTTATCNKNNSIKNNKKKSFAETLMWLLLNDQYSQIVTFLPDETSFGIVDAKRFTDEVMPQVFGIRTFSSFVRKLHRWGFERLMEKKTHDVDVFRHALLRKGDWKSCSNIKCVGRLSRHNHQKTNKNNHNTTKMTTMPLPSMALTGLKRPRPTQAMHSNTTMTTTTRPFYHCAIQDMTSQVVGAALATLRRDENVQRGVAPNHNNNDVASLQRLLAQRRMQREMMALQGTGLSSLDTTTKRMTLALQQQQQQQQRQRNVSPRSSLSFFY